MNDEVELFRKLQKLLNKAVGYYEVGDKERCCCVLGLLIAQADKLGDSISPEGTSAWANIQIKTFMTQVMAEVNQEL